MKVLLVTPPMSNLTTPYPATAYLMGHLRTAGVDVRQADWSLELACRLFSKPGLERLREWVCAVAEADRSPRLAHFLAEFERYRAAVEPVVGFLQGRDPSLATQIASGRFLPRGRRLRRYLEGPKATDRDRAAFGLMGAYDRASLLASLYLCDLADIVWEVEPGFSLESYAATVADSRSFDAVLDFMATAEGGLTMQLIEEVAADGIGTWSPDVLGLTVPFPGALVGALKTAEVARRLVPKIKIVLGGGYANTSLRELTDPRVFDFVDYITLDDGERPMTCLLQHLAGQRDADGLLRTFAREAGRVVYRSAPAERDVPFAAAATPTYAGLPLDRYMAIWFHPTPGQRIWSKRWNKITLAHGCYWRKCTFCDVTLDYVGRFEPQRVDRLLTQIETIIAETGSTGFHWVDEAAPPSLLRRLSRQILKRNLTISWWGNIRFERAFTPDLARLMAEAGCVMITAGLEVACDRLLERIDKGVTVAQVAQVAKGFAEHGIHVHAYLMYGFPTQTVQETIDSPELVRQLFAAGCLHSGHWHRFEATIHSPIGMDPERFGIRLADDKPVAPNRVFARYKVPFDDPTGVDHGALGKGLRRALRRYERGIGLDRPVHKWFPDPVPKTTIGPDTISRALASRPIVTLAAGAAS